MRDRRALVSTAVKFEYLYSAQSHQQFIALERQLDALRELWLAASVLRTAVGAMRDLSEISPGYHRVGGR